MYPKLNDLPSPIRRTDAAETLDAMIDDGDVNETPFNVFVGHNLGHRVFTISIPFRKFAEISAVANNRETGPVAQRQLDENHAKKLAVYMVKGLVSAAKMRRMVASKDVPTAFDDVLRALGEQPYYSLQPLVCNIRDIPPAGVGHGGIRGFRLETREGETAAFRVFLAERHTLWVVDGQHRRHAADLAMKFLEEVRLKGKYPRKGAVLFADKGRDVTENEMLVWNEAYDAARSYATLTVEVHLGLNIEQERQLFHDLNRLGKKVDASLAFQFDGSNPITHFIKRSIVADIGLNVTESEVRDWSEDTGALVLKDVVAINAIAFLNKSNITGATPAIVEPREPIVMDMWSRISDIPHFGDARAKEHTVAAQPVVLKAIAKIVYDLSFSNRRPSNSDELLNRFLEEVPKFDFSHGNSIWQYYDLSEKEKIDCGLEGLAVFLPDDAGGNRDIGSFQGGYMRFGAKHNDIYPIVADMLRWAIGLPNRREG